MRAASPVATENLAGHQHQLAHAIGPSFLIRMLVDSQLDLTPSVCSGKARWLRLSSPMGFGPHFNPGCVFFEKRFGVFEIVGRHRRAEFADCRLDAASVDDLDWCRTAARARPVNR